LIEPFESEANSQELWAAESVFGRAIAHLGSAAEAVLVRTPIAEPLSPSTSDVDLLVFGQVDDLCPQRLFLSDRLSSRAVVDVTWYPVTSLGDPPFLARAGLVAHRLLSSVPVFDPTGRAGAQREVVRELMYQPHIQAQRIASFLHMGYLTVREIGITWNFPALARFWLQMAYAACVAAICDGIGGLCPNVYTRPFGYVEHIERDAGTSLRQPLVTTLGLDSDPLDLIDPLRRIHRVVSRFREPDWSPNMPAATRAEYRYFVSGDELDWRMGVAREMVERGDSAAAVWYLRFWAYSLARIPIVWNRAQEGLSVSFLRPERAVRPDLERHCPDILDDFAYVLGGERPVTPADVNDSLAELHRLRDWTVQFLSRRGLQVPEGKAWRPFERPSKAMPV